MEFTERGKKLRKRGWLKRRSRRKRTKKGC